MCETSKLFTFSIFIQFFMINISKIMEIQITKKEDLILYSSTFFEKNLVILR